MSPILGIYASQISGHLWAPSGAYDSIATVTVGSGGSSSITFTSIPSTYTHLQIRALSRGNRAYTAENIIFMFNADGGTNYADHLLYGNGSTVPAAADVSSSTPLAFRTSTSNTQASNIFGTGVLDILDYANTNKYKTVRSLSGFDDNGGGYGQIWFTSGLWQSTAAINSITLTPVGTAIQQYSQFALYGVK